MPSRLRFRLLPKLVTSYVALAVVATLLSLLGERYIQRKLAERTSYRTEILRQASDLQAAAGSAAEESLSYGLKGEDDERMRAVAKLDVMIAAARGLPFDASLSSEERRKLVEIAPAVTKFRDAALAMFEAYPHASSIPGDRYAAYEAGIDGLLDELKELRTVVAAENARQLDAARSRSDELTMLVGLVAALVAVGLGTAFARRIVTPLATLRDAVVAFGAGKLDRATPMTNGDEISELTSAFEHMTAAATAHIETIGRAEQRANAANVAKSEFLANMSHEIRTPMTAILGFGDLLLEPDLSLDERTAHVRIIRRNGRQLLGLIDDILDLSKIEAGKMVLEQIPCSPQRVVADVVSLLRVPALDKGLSLRVVYATPLPATIQSDPTRIRQVLMNLISNAIKFTSRGGITLTVRCLDPNTPSPSLELEVRDTGAGIAMDKLEHVFSPFAQADASTTRKFGGTGLGLAISSRLATALGGALTLSSAVDVGSTFTLRIATGALTNVAMLVGEQEAGPSDLTPSTTSSGVRGRVLLAEDGPDNQLLITAYLRRAGATVTVAENGRVAVDKAREALAAGVPFDLVLMDMQMPELDGYGATRELRAVGYTLPVVALTAHAMTGDKEKCLAAGCTEYMTKPVDRDVLGAVLQRYLRRGVDASPGPLVSLFAGDDDMKELVRGFVGKLPERAGTIDDALTGGDMDGLRRAAHQLRGAAGGYGFPTITDAAARVEVAIGEGMDTTRLKPLTLSLTALCRSARTSAPPPARH